MSEIDLELLEAQQKEKEKLAGVQYATSECETIVDGKYCPKFTISTNEKTEYVTISFSTVGGISLNILMTKKEFAKFTTQLSSFLNIFASKSVSKPLIRD